MPTIDVTTGAVGLYEWEKRRLFDAAKLCRLLRRNCDHGTAIGLCAETASSALDELATLLLADTPEVDTPREDARPTTRRRASRKRS